MKIKATVKSMRIKDVHSGDVVNIVGELFFVTSERGECCIKCARMSDGEICSFTSDVWVRVDEGKFYSTTIPIEHQKA